jgi:hypothetical protein
MMIDDVVTDAMTLHRSVAVLYWYSQAVPANTMRSPKTHLGVPVAADIAADTIATLATISGAAQQQTVVQKEPRSQTAAPAVAVDGAHTTQPTGLAPTMPFVADGVAVEKQVVLAKKKAPWQVVDVNLPPLPASEATKSVYVTAGVATHRTKEGVRLFPEEVSFPGGRQTLHQVQQGVNRKQEEVEETCGRGRYCTPLVHVMGACVMRQVSRRFAATARLQISRQSPLRSRPG